MRLALQASQFEGELPQEVCPNCYSEMSSITSRGAKLRAQQSARHQNLKIVWKNRLKLLKKGKKKMQERNFTEAAVLYEKYIRAVEIVFSKKPGELTPDDFKGIKRKEMSALTSVYWDLIRIFDTGSRNDQRMKAAADKLVLFFPHSKGQSDLAKKIQAFSRNCRNPKIMKPLIRQIKIKSGSCYIATATYGDSNSAQVLTFYRFRDEILIQSTLGRNFIKFYYSTSPHLAKFVDKSLFLKKLSRFVLDRIALLISQKLG